MPHDPAQVQIFHITDVTNLAGIIQAGGLLSDAKMAIQPYAGIGYDHIKERRLTRYRIPCCGNRFVGEFVPFYFCPRSPMLYTINRGNTGRPPGCQTEIVHLVSTVADGIALGREWAISDGNAGAGHAEFECELSALDALNWPVIRATSWARQTHEKMAEFLVADFYEWSTFREIACHNNQTRAKAAALLASADHKPNLTVKPAWYYQP
jgi:hypothetical protein